MADTAAVNPDIKIEEIGPCRKKLSFKVSADDARSVMESSVDDAAEVAHLPGFRPGKAPRKLVRKKFSKQMRDEAVQNLAREAYSKAIEDHDLRVLGDPEGGDALKDYDPESGEDLTFELEVEVAPEFDMPKLEGIDVMRPTVEVTDDMANEELERLAVNEGKLESKDKGGPGDYCTGRGVMTLKKGGDEVLNLEGAVIQIPDSDDGSGMILGCPIEGFDKICGSPKSGDVIKVETKAPESHDRPEARGQDVVIEFSVEDVNQIIPATADELAKRHGLEDEQALRERMMLMLNQRLLVQQQDAMRTQVARYLNDNVSIELPGRLTESQAERNLQRRKLDLLYQGEDEQAIIEKTEELAEASSEAAKRELTMFFILDRVAREHDIDVSENEVLGRIAQIAQQRGQNPVELRDHLIKTNQVGSVAQQIREHKTLDELVAKATISDVPADEFNEKMREAGDGEAPKPAAKKKTAKKTAKKTTKKAAAKKTTKKTSK